MERITKVFQTDEVETHALSEVQLEIQPGEFVSIAALRGAENQRSFRSWVCWILRPAETIGYTATMLKIFQLQTGRASAIEKVHLQSVQFDRRPGCIRKRRTAANVSLHNG